MSIAGSFYPLENDSNSDRPVLFAFASNAKDQREALNNEALQRLRAASALSDALVSVKVEPHGASTHAPFFEAISILAHDAQGLLEISMQIDSK